MTLPFITNLVGHTRTGKEIHVCSLTDLRKLVNLRYALFVPIELLDAHAVFEYLAIREYKRPLCNEDVVKRYGDHSRVCITLLGGLNALRDMKKESELTTVLEVIKYGESLVTPEFRNF